MKDINHNIVAHSAKMQSVLRTVDLVAGTDVPVLISGETGTGKDLVARRIHQQSARCQRAFVKIACSSNNVSGDRFADMVKRARSGTLFLDALDALSDAGQKQLLHFIETSEVVRSDTRVARFDVRIIVATQHNLYQAVEAGEFRADLFFRLNVIPVELPVLQEREGDVVILMEHFFRLFVHERHLTPPSFSKAALKLINRYAWPGNVRELRNFCERMLILFPGKVIEPTNLPREMQHCSVSGVGQGTTPFNLPDVGINLESVEVDLMLQALDKSSGNKSKAARLLGLSRDTFLYRLKKYSIAL